MSLGKFNSWWGGDQRLSVFRRKKAVSTIIGTILMINVAIGMGAIYVVWANGLLGDYASKALVYFSLLEEGIDEEITLEKAWFESSNKVAVVVRNIGVREANITTIYINGQAIKQYNTTQNLPYKLLVGRRVAFEVTYAWTLGSTYSFSVATSRGTQAKGDWVA